MEELLDAPKVGLPAQEVRACRVCGWWTYWLMAGTTLLHSRSTQGPTRSLYGAIGELKGFDISAVDAPIEEIRRYLAAKYESRFECHPRLFEETVRSVFEGLGFHAEATAYSRDGGVDVVLRHSDGTTTGIQVKRSGNPIQVEQIRSLAGALLHGGHTAGVFVTTSHFTSGAHAAQRVLAERGVPIELVDSRRFFDALHISQRSPYAGYDAWHAVHGEPVLQTVYEDE